ncbi:tRNA1(Val) (adenine(37)-N6)-methyltransferase [Fundidesulfovibrio soli]|uniref:tRNA1(Val) (adenine(37)-N6)-methyltransferase n=1 Tax=Fundidesulfovibrio soli TaxID=2922716 RepID=UPI001FAF8F92|nr:50S ribosomal protein L11 methyltransferase [Fundidesulfovibrio soli]
MGGEAASLARDAFPNGLRQPEGGYRFSLDPLLLAAFVRPKRNVAAADLGSGCGVASFAALMLHPALRSCLGLDIDPAMTGSSLENARLLGLEDRFEARTFDIRAARDGLTPESRGLVLANPPYRILGTGQPCRDAARTLARFEARGGLEDFLAAAFWVLSNRGTLGMIFPAARLGELLGACIEARLAPKRLRMVHSRLDEPARLILLEAVKNGGSETTIEPPLELYTGRGEETALSAQALEFCPFLAANAKARSCSIS